ncbi:unnamed protein product [Didymodactylos carnosus]|uniref:Integrase catalytic domain-containing protein n=1 Tax=Didymodactylos carnosus TaxID=1234261 RepID=A0A814V3X6_9BILA|nr:unnamed protein product [Didymodactylos carnosus]CAF3948115.1 unnamed protein product [Didymodactylos carnosus]
MPDYLSRSPVDDPTEDLDDYVQRISRETQTDNNNQVPVTKQSIIAAVTTRLQGKQGKRDNDDQADAGTSDNPVMCPNKEAVQSKDKPRTDANTQVLHELDHYRIIPFTHDDIRQQQLSDPTLQQILNNLEKEKHKNYIMRRQQLKLVPVVPKGKIRKSIMQIYHDTPANDSHFGRDRTLKTIGERYYWPTMNKDIRNYVRSCLKCRQNNHNRRKPDGHLKPISPPEGVFELLSMDFHGPITPLSKNQNKYIITITDNLSKFVIGKAVRDCTAPTAAKFLRDEVILKYGTPKAILSDNGSHFTASMMNELFTQFGIIHLYSTPYHPQTNACIERFNAKSPHYQDPDHLGKLNTYIPGIVEEAKKNIVKQQQNSENRYNQNRSNPQYKIGDLVLIKTTHVRHKFDIRNEGPFRITQKTYVVQHVKRLDMKRQVTTDVIIPLSERPKFDLKD